MRQLLAALICLSIAFGSVAQRIPDEVVSTVIEASAVQAAAGQQQLYCAQANGRMLGCWNKSKYDSWVQNQAKLEDYRTRGISDYERQHMVVPPSGGVANAPACDFNIHEGVTVHDATGAHDIRVDTNVPSGVAFENQFGQDAMRVLPGMVLDFQAKQAAYAQIQAMYQQVYQQAEQQNAAVVQQLRNEAAQDQAAAESRRNAIFPNIAVQMASLPIQNLSASQLNALKSARRMSESALSHRTYQMNQAAYIGLQSKMKRALLKKDYDAFFEGVEPLTRAQVGGQRVSVSSFGGVINKDGVVNISKLTGGRYSGPFDNRGWSTTSSSAEGEVVRRLANKFQQAYLDTNALAVSSQREAAEFSLGSLALALGDTDIAKGLYERGSSFLKLAEQMVVAVAGSTLGVAEGAVDLVKSIPELAGMMKDGAILWTTNPKETWEAVVDLARSLPELGGVLKAAAILKFEQMADMSDFDRGRAIGHLTFDVVTTLSALGDLATARALTQAGKLEGVAAAATSATLRASIEGAADAMAAGAAPLEKSVAAMPRAARIGSLALAAKSPETLVALAQAHTEMQLAGKIATVGFIERVMASGAPMAGIDVADLVQSHAKLVESLEKLSPTEFEGVISRGGPLTVKDANGLSRALTKEELLSSLSATNSLLEHRFTIGGELGEKGLYYVIGDANSAAPTILKEMHVTNAAEIQIASKQLSSAKVLDLTRPEVMDFLKSNGFSQPLEGAISPYTQALGNAARSAGFDGIVFQSAQAPGVKNLVLFK